MSLPNMTPNHSPAVYKLEREIALLPVEDKLQLRDGLDRQIRAAALGKSVIEIEAELEEMANDPDIQRELAAIDLMWVGEHDREIGALAADFDIEFRFIV